MNKGKRIDLFKGILMVVVVFLLVLCLSFGDRLEECKNSNTCDNSQGSVVDNDDMDSSSSEDKNIDDDKEREYDCSFTRTYKVVDMLDDVPDYFEYSSFVLVDIFQYFDPFVVRISNEDKKKLKVGEWYEFTYSLKGTGIINDMDDVEGYLLGTIDAMAMNREISTVKVDLDIKNIEPNGLDGIQENICGIED